MSLKNSSSLIDKVLKYLKMPSSACDEMKLLIQECIEEIEKISEFKYIYKRYDKKFEFLNNMPYSRFLDGCNGYYFIAVTLGLEVERKIRLLSKTNASKMVIFDAAASAVLEVMANDFENKLGKNLTSRFCPGYEKSSVEDIKIIYDELKADRIGIQLLDSYMMSPQKTMIGIVGIKNI